MADCLFCKIVEAKIPASKVYEDEEVLGFKDIHPQAPIHYLFIPKRHFASLTDVSADQSQVMGPLFKAINKVASQLPELSDGFRTIINSGKNGGQVVFHLHVHLLGGKPLGPMVSES